MPKEEKNAAATTAPTKTEASAEAPKKAPSGTKSESDFNEETGILTVVTTDPESGKSAKIEFNVGKTAAEAIEKFGDKVVLSKLTRELYRNLSNNGRSRLKAGKSPEEVAKELGAWKPGVTMPRVAGKSKAKEAAKQELMAELAGLSPEEMVAKLQAMVAAGK